MLVAVSATSPTAKVLLIEDDLDTRVAIAEFIRDEGFAVDTARSVKDAFQLVDKHSYSLVLSDVWDRGIARWPDIGRLIDMVDPTPVGACTASRVQPPPDVSPRLAFFL